MVIAEGERRMKRNVPKNKNFAIADILAGGLTTMTVSLISISIFAILISSEWIREDSTGFCALAVLLLSSISGAAAIRIRKMEIQPQINLIVGAIYLIVLFVITIIFFEQEFQGIIVTSIVVFSGCLLPAMLSKRKKNRRKRIREKKRRC